MAIKKAFQRNVHVFSEGRQGGGRETAQRKMQKCRVPRQHWGVVGGGTFILKVVGSQEKVVSWGAHRKLKIFLSAGENLKARNQ